MSSLVHPRPLVGEPLPLDLLNTRWLDDEGTYDLLEMPGGLAIWLESAGLDAEVDDPEGVLAALRSTREALLAVALGSGALPARELLNDVLRHGRVARLLGEDGPISVVEIDSGSWAVAWRAAEEYLQLLAQKPERLRKCANPDCPLRFYDLSKAGSRRWCSMTTCGNRSKARTHYARTHGAG